jgi:hypothetical protein
MKRKLVLVLLVIAVMFILAVNVRAAAVATPGEDFIDMYKAYFRDMQANRHQQVWDALTLASKNAVAKTLHDSVVSATSQSEQPAFFQKLMNNPAKKPYSQAEILEMFNNNTLNLRADYFAAFAENYEKISFFNRVLAGRYLVKSSAKERIVITIYVDEAPRDFQILLEEGRWKINFIDDMMR